MASRWLPWSLLEIWRQASTSSVTIRAVTQTNFSLLYGGNFHDDVIKWKKFPRYWSFVQEIHWSPVNSPHKGQWRRALIFSLICALINGFVNNREADDFKRHRAHYDDIVMWTVRKAQVEVVLMRSIMMGVVLDSDSPWIVWCMILWVGSNNDR